jgi:hypothetical protein
LTATRAEWKLTLPGAPICQEMQARPFSQILRAASSGDEQLFLTEKLR